MHRSFIHASLLLALVACGGAAGASPRAPAQADQVVQLTSNYDSAIGEVVEAWNNLDLEAIRTVYSIGIVHEDASSGALLQGIEEVAAMASTVMTFFPAMRTEVVDRFVAADSVLIVYEISNLELGGSVFSEAQPLIEVDRLDTNGERVSYWKLFYGIETLERMRSVESERAGAMRQLLSDYESAWSSGAPRQVAALYSQDGERVDSLFSETAQGRQGIQASAASFFATYPNALFELKLPFGDGSGDHPLTGGVFSVTSQDANGVACEVQMAVLLQTVDGGIVAETIYYQPESLLGCGWAE